MELPRRTLGVGTDLVDVERVRAAIARTPGLLDRLFTDAEREYAARHRDPSPHLAARFAAKEAVMKALGVGMSDIGFAEIEVVRLDSGRPTVELHGRAQTRAASAGVSSWMLSLTHTDTTAHAIAIALG